MRPWQAAAVVSILASSALASTITASLSTATSTSITKASVSATTAFNSSGTCKSVSVNYVSPGLPQQCLRTRERETTQITSTSSTREGISTDSAVASESVSAEASSTNVSATTATVSLSPPSSSSATADTEDSPLDNVKFLSFEEWKEQNLAKAGQSSESFSERGARDPRRGAPGSGSGALDALGDEIEIDLGGFGSGSSGGPEKTVQVQAKGAPKPSSAAGMPRSKDAGKTCKERFNYASFDCAATVHRNNKEGKSGNSILVENKDTYMLNKCEAKDKFFIVELCEDILVDTVVLANFEFFSSVFKELRVSVSDRYPVKSSGWKELGTFTAKNTRDVQAFLIENPLIWARYIKVDLLSHYGSEYYCPLSLFRVHGTTMMEEFRNHEGAARGEIVDDVREEVVPEAVAEQVKSLEKEKSTQTVDAPVPPTEKSEPENTVSGITVVTVSSVTASRASISSHQSQNKHLVFTALPLMCLPQEKPRLGIESAASMTSPNPPPSTVAKEPISKNFAAASSIPISSTSSTSLKSEMSTSISAEPSVMPSPPSIATVKSEPASSGYEHKPSPPQPPIATPSTQESFFKSVHKRLTHLEANTTLSFQYIEEQSRMLRDAFTKMEKKQIVKVEQMLDQLNMSVFADLKVYREKYDQLWQSTVIALESQREHSDREILAISSRLTLLADEVIFQKRMYQVNTILLLITIGIVLFGRTDARLTMPLVQHLRTRSSMRIFESPPNSPPPPPQTPLSPGSVSPRPRHNSMDSTDSNSPAMEFSPPTPPQEYGNNISRSSPTTPNGTRNGDSRKSWIHFGPQLRVESRGRRWQRLPSPLGDPDPGSPIYQNGSKTAVLSSP
ncbi:UNC-like C-terminal-domain-containing protein [Geopyxis carbonaria]|nr:UNC-like C-terminal-domain-containing protein [Geopyxis carbonaria]